MHVDAPAEALRSGRFAESFPRTELEVRDRAVSFPVVPRVGVHELQVALTNPSNALVAAWATLHRNSSPLSGWLLPFHAVGASGAAVDYDDGTAGRVVESFGACIDAAVASTNAAPTHLTPVVAPHTLAPGAMLEVVDQTGASSQPTLMDVDLNIGLVAYSKAPIRLTYDWTTSVQGDSGALVRFASDRGSGCDAPGSEQDP